MKGLIQRRNSAFSGATFALTIDWRWTVIAGLVLGFGMRAHADPAIYTDSLVNEWQFQSSSLGSPDFSNSDPVHSGSYSIAITIPANYVQNDIFLISSPPQIDTTGYNYLSFWLNGGPDGVDFVTAVLGYFNLITNPWDFYDTEGLGGAAPSTWRNIDIPLPSNEIQDPTKFALICLFIGHGDYATLPYDTTFYIDDMRLTAVPEPSAAALASLGVLGAGAAFRRRN